MLQSPVKPSIEDLSNRFSRSQFGDLSKIRGASPIEGPVPNLRGPVPNSATPVPNAGPVPNWGACPQFGRLSPTRACPNSGGRESGPALVLGFYLAVAPKAFGAKHERNPGPEFGALLAPATRCAGVILDRHSARTASRGQRLERLPYVGAHGRTRARPPR
jgi:hypothetical protein